MDVLAIRYWIRVPGSTYTVVVLVKNSRAAVPCSGK
jgi:hypothetical protein